MIQDPLDPLDPLVQDASKSTVSHGSNRQLSTSCSTAIRMQGPVWQTTFICGLLACLKHVETIKKRISCTSSANRPRSDSGLRAHRSRPARFSLGKTVVFSWIDWRYLEIHLAGRNRPSGRHIRALGLCPWRRYLEMARIQVAKFFIVSETGFGVRP